MPFRSSFNNSLSRGKRAVASNPRVENGIYPTNNRMATPRMVVSNVTGMPIFA